MNWCTSAVRRTATALSFVALASPVGLAGCTGKACTAEAKFSLSVTVLDASGRRVCDAAVTARDGDFSARLSASDDTPTACTYLGVPERKGNYSVEAQSGSKRARLSDVKVSGDACHVRTRDVSLRLA